MRRLIRWELAGFLWTSAAGTLLHFVYEWSGNHPVAAAFAAVNESVWEHMKLMVMPVFLFTVVQVWVQGEAYPNITAARPLSMAVGTALIPVLFYTYTGILGMQAAWVNILIFYLAAAVLFWWDYSLLRRGRFSAVWAQLLGVVALWTIVSIFVWCTYRPVRLPLWQDYVTGGYGIAG